LNQSPVTDDLINHAYVNKSLKGEKNPKGWGSESFWVWQTHGDWRRVAEAPHLPTYLALFFHLPVLGLHPFIVNWESSK